MNSSSYEALAPLLAEPEVDPGRTERFELFLRDQREALVSFLRMRTSTEEDAHDAAQESLVRLMRYRDTQPPDAWKALLYRIAVNVVHDQLRWAKRRNLDNHVPMDDATYVLPSEAPQPDEQAVCRQELARIGAVIHALPPRCQEVYLLSRVEGMKNVEIARHCGISVKAVEKHMTRAMAAVRQALGNFGPEAL